MNSPCIGTRAGAICKELKPDGDASFTSSYLCCSLHNSCPNPLNTLRIFCIGKDMLACSTLIFIYQQAQCVPIDTTTHHDTAYNVSAPRLFSAMELVRSAAEKSLCYSNYTVSIFLPPSFSVKAKRWGKENNFCHSRFPEPGQRHEEWQKNQEFTHF